MKRIVIFGGSLRSGSHTLKIMELAAKKARAAGWEVTLLDINDLNLPFCHGGLDYSAYPDVARLREAFRGASGGIIATPEYHGCVSGALKNALDLLGYEEFQGKVFAPISILGGERSTHALATIRRVCRQLRAWVTPNQLAIPFADTAFDAQGELIDNKLNQRLEELIDTLIAGAASLAD